MAFNFPIAQNNFGQMFAEGIARAIDTYRQGQQLQRQRTLTELQNPGFHFGAMPTAGEAVQRMDNGVIPSYSEGGISSPSVPVSQPSQFQQTIANAVGSMPKAERNAPASTVDSRYIPLSGGYLNTGELMQRLLPQMQLQARGKYLESAAEASGKAAGDPTESALRVAQTNLAQRNAGALRLGDPTYAGAMGDVAGAQEAGRNGPLLARARAEAADRAAALSGAQIPGGGTITPQTASAIGTVPGVAGALLRPAALIPGTPQWLATKQAESDIVEGRTERLFAPRTAAAINTKAGELALTPLNDNEQTATMQLPRLASAAQFLAAHGSPGALQKAASGNWSNYLNSAEGQQLVQAANQAAMAGALATEGKRGAQPTRVKFFQETYVPRGGDSPEVVQQKLEGLRELAKSAKQMAGRGYARMDAGQRSQVESFIGNPTANSGVAAKYGITPTTP